MRREEERRVRGHGATRPRDDEGNEARDAEEKGAACDEYDCPTVRREEWGRGGYTRAGDDEDNDARWKETE